MGTTNALALPFPELTETADGPDAFSDLANAVEDYFYDRILPAGVTRVPRYHWGDGITPPATTAPGLRIGDTYFHTNQGVMLAFTGTEWRQAGFPTAGSDTAPLMDGQYRHGTGGLESSLNGSWHRVDYLRYGRVAFHTTSTITPDQPLTPVISLSALPFPNRVIWTALGRAGFASAAQAMGWDWDSTPSGTGWVTDKDDQATRITAAAAQWQSVVSTMHMDAPAGGVPTARLVLRASGAVYNRGSVIWERTRI